jgi:hypothetical protein
MFDIVEYFKNKVEIWNQDQQCGLCFEFSAPLFNSEMNVQQNNSCCVQVFVANILTDTVYKNDFNIYGFQNIDYCVYTFDLFFLVQSPMGLNNYNEIQFHPIEESKWETIFKPLLNCFGCGKNLCEEVYNFGGYINYSTSLVHNYLDNNYNGLKVRAKIKINAN